MESGKSRYYTIGEYLMLRLRPGLSMETGQKLKEEAMKLSEERFIEIKYQKGYGIRYRLEAPKFKEEILIEVFDKHGIYKKKNEIPQQEEGKAGT